MISTLRKKVKGFTLIELLIVVAIIGILAAIAIPNLLQAQRRSKNSRAATDSKQIVTQMQLFINDNNALPSTAPGCAANQPLCLWDKSSPGNTIYMATSHDPWGCTAGCGTVGVEYRYDEAAGGVATALTAEIRAWSRGGNGSFDTAAGASFTSDDIGYSNYSGGYNF